MCQRDTIPQAGLEGSPGLWDQVVGLRCRGCACVGWGSYSRPPSRPRAGRRGKSWGKILKKPEIGFKTRAAPRGAAPGLNYFS